ncbi:unnamed protein product [Enterobius vermicularis]|uniref:Glutamine-dependent NAD(+) synthetase n=1 Tax=Enterobius vermicularis TaxID=51028 RepID=A0A0N4UV43_ENTVE|nr:unnamed protein product [Enterobius vermicularis]
MLSQVNTNLQSGNVESSLWHRKVCVSVCSLNQWALDFEGNRKRILKSIEEAHKQGAKIRVGLELEIPGYGCQDHFHEMDTEYHSWEVLDSLLAETTKYRDMIIVTGMPVRFNTELYNCNVVFQNGKILLIRPKMKFCDDDVYRESRYFVRWQNPKQLVEYRSPLCEEKVGFGDAVLRTSDGVLIGFEMCEELWTTKSPHVDLALHGVDIVCNSSASHHVVGKSAHRINHLVLATTSKVGGIYLYSNHRGCDGDRVYYDGMSSIAQNGKLYAQIPQFGLEEVAVATAILDLQENYNFRYKIYSSMTDAASTPKYPEIYIPHPFLVRGERCLPSPEVQPSILSKEEELLSGPPAFLWNYLRRSGMRGFFLPLSGGADSASVAVMVRAMCEKVFDSYSKAIKSEDFNCDDYKIGGELIEVSSADELCKKVPTEIDFAVDAFTGMVSKAFDADDFSANIPWDEPRVSLGMQNVQARVRMVTAYLFAQLACYFGKKSGSLLVLGSSNVDESLVGYVTKYDCSAADLNPIGSVLKRDLRSVLRYARDTMGLSSLSQIIDAEPTAELLPTVAGETVQLDEEEIGLTYDEISEIGHLRKPGCLGPYGIFLQLLPRWADVPIETVPYHAERYSCDDHRNDHRPFLYNTSFTWQFDKIDQFVRQHGERR